MTTNLYLFPENANFKSGYGIACENDYRRISPNKNDIIIWYTNNKNNIYLKEDDFIIPRPSTISYRRLKNILKFNVSTEILINDLNILNNFCYNNIFCGDVIFYNSIRKLFPNRKITVRFHNCFSRIYDRKRILKYKFDPIFEYNLRTFYKLETKIFRDNNVNKIFITKEDQDYYKLMTGNEDSSLWAFEFDSKLAVKNRKPINYNNKLVFFGGVSSHKKKSIEWFIKSILPEIRAQIPCVEFHLWGNNTKQFNQPDKLIFGHGFFNSNGFPLRDEALYINPDIIGGGVKIKLLTYYNNGIPFISTPFGYEGYSKQYIDNRYCIVSNIDKWSKDIVNILRNGKKVNTQS
jgi:hypothetical protein